MKLEGESGTFVLKVARSTRWHLYVSAAQGTFLSGNFPRKIVLTANKLQFIYSGPYRYRVVEALSDTRYRLRDLENRLKGARYLPSPFS